MKETFFFLLLPLFPPQLSLPPPPPLRPLFLLGWSIGGGPFREDKGIVGEGEGGRKGGFTRRIAMEEEQENKQGVQKTELMDMNGKNMT